MEVGEPEEVICPACYECSAFTIMVIKDAPDERQAASWAKCESCGHLIEITMVGRYALTDRAGRVETLVGGHIEPHFADGSDPYITEGLCVCPCGECTTLDPPSCVCLDCPCEGPEDHAAFID